MKDVGYLIMYSVISNNNWVPTLRYHQPCLQDHCVINKLIMYKTKVELSPSAYKSRELALTILFNLAQASARH